MTDRAHFDDCGASYQAEAAEERRFRRMVWTLSVCGCLAVWSVLAAVAWGAM